MSLQHFADSAVRAYKIATMPPMGPVLSRARRRAAGESDPGRGEPAHPEARAGRSAARRFRRAGRSGEDAGRGAESRHHLRSHGANAGGHGITSSNLPKRCNAAVIDNVGRMNFPSRHPLNQSFRRGLIGQADVVLAIEMNDLWGAVNAFNDRIERRSRPATKRGAKIITLGVRDLYLKSNYQDFGRCWGLVDLDIAGDGEVSLPALTEAVKRLADPSRKTAFAERGRKLAAAAFGNGRARSKTRRHDRLGCEPDHHGADVR